jgi:hypothetical protein
MLSAASIDDKFEIQFEVLENGSGTFSGVIDEIVQNQAPSFVFVPPRRLLRVAAELPVQTAMVIRSEGGAIYMVAEHGESESWQGTVFKSFRLFPTHEKFDVKRRMKTVDLVTNLPKDEGEPVSIANVWGAYEPLQEQFDRETRVAAETARFITNYPIQREDIIDNKRVFRVDKQLGLWIATLS